MSYIFIALFAYFLMSLGVILDKFLLTAKKISHPVVFAFYSGMLSFFTIFLAPFGFHWVDWGTAVLYIFGGMIFTYGILFLFFAISRNEASRVTPVVGSVTAIITYIISNFFLKEQLGGWQNIGIAILIIGSLVISLNFSSWKSGQRFYSGFGYSITAGVLIAVALSVFKAFYDQEQNFVNDFYSQKQAFIHIFIWTRVGLVFGALSLLIVDPWREIILNSLAKFNNPKKENVSISGLFIFNKLMGGVGSILNQYAISLGSVAVVNALISVEYAFVFVIGFALSFKFPDIFQEKRQFANIAKKIAAITLISIGIALVSIK